MLDWLRRFPKEEFATLPRTDISPATNECSIVIWPGRKTRGPTDVERLNLTNEAIADFNKGVEFSDCEDWDTAIVCYNKAIHSRNDYYKAYVNRGIAYTNNLKYDQAIADYTNAIYHKSDCATAYYNRGVTFAMTRDYDKAIKACKTVMTLMTLPPPVVPVEMRESPGSA